MNHSLERSHLKSKEMCDYQTGPINPLKSSCVFPHPADASCHTWHSEQQSELQKHIAESGPWKKEQPPHTAEQHM